MTENRGNDSMRGARLILIPVIAVVPMVGMLVSPAASSDVLLAFGLVWMGLTVAVGLALLGPPRQAAVGPPFRCPQCGYDLRGTREVRRCAECGADNVFYRPESRWSLQRMKRLVADIALANRRQ